MTAKIWDKLTVYERFGLIRKAYPERGEGLVAHEASLKWNKLLPSTQEAIAATQRKGAK